MRVRCCCAVLGLDSSVQSLGEAALDQTGPGRDALHYISLKDGVRTHHWARQEDRTDYSQDRQENRRTGGQETMCVWSLSISEQKHRPTELD